MLRWVFALSFLALTASLSMAGGPPSQKVFPFVLPWDDSSPGVTNLSAWLPKPAGKFGPVHAGKNGHLYTGDRRIRFFGVNTCFGASFPSKKDAGKVAARMAKFGINVVRFHHMDMFPFPQGIRARGAAGTGTLDHEALDRLDYFIAQLQRNGIYANLNLLVSRPFAKADGLPADIERVGDWKARHAVGFFHQPILRLQKEYSRNLLAHRNPYTKKTYAEDPGVAFVEINNENGLIQAWMSSQVDGLPDIFLRDLRRQWNAWLSKRHRTTDLLRATWGAHRQPLGRELLTNADFAHDKARWVLESHDQAKAGAAMSDDVPQDLQNERPRSVRINITKAGRMGWHVQFNQPGLKVRAERPYTLTFWAKADTRRSVGVLLGQAQAPWHGLGFTGTARLTAGWKRFRFVFLPSAADDNARLNFTDLARKTGSVWLAGISLRPGGVVGLAADEQLEKGTVQLFRRAHSGERTAEGQRDWLRFLRDTENTYWQAMDRYLKDDLKVRGVVIGTIVGCSTPNLMARLDAVDTHAYWQHPQFPHRAWDPDDWIVPNRPMVNEAGGTLPGLALRRVRGKPHCVTEYNHPAPNTYGAEGFLLLAAYGALQDWDAIYAFDYSADREWNKRRIGGFFDIDQHPTKMATLPAAVALFVRGDVKPASQELVAALSPDREIDALRTSWAWELVHGGHAGLPREAALVHRLALGVGLKAMSSADKFPRPAGPRYASDTGELLWDLTDKQRGVVTVNTPKSKAVIGYGSGKRFELGNVTLQPGATAQDGWGILTVTVMEGKLSSGPARLLLTAVGTAENTDMRWKSTARDSVGRHWGTAPSRVEGVPGTITLPRKPDRVGAWALDERGRRKAVLLIQGKDGKATVSFGAQHRTLWYEIELK
jgi:hypothetical protein